MAQRSKSQQHFERALAKIPGGVNSPVRGFSQVGVYPPLVVERAWGSTVEDCDGQRYLDYIGAWGPMILGHADADVVSAIQAAATQGLSYGLTTAAEGQFAELLTEIYPSMHKVRLVNSGTEATMTAIRLARGFTKRRQLIKFEGCYHGHSDALLVQAGSGLATFATKSRERTSAPSSEGVDENVAAQTIVLPFNDLAAVETTLKQQADSVAAIILEPVVGNMGCVPPLPGYLQGLRALCDKFGVVLILDEVMTGCRIALGGAQARYGVAADLTTLSKIIGGGLPLGAVGGRAEIMDLLSPLGKVYQAGTLSGNPLAVAAGMATLRKLSGWQHRQSGLGAYDYLEMLGNRLQEALQPILASATIPLTLQRVGSMFTLFFSATPIVNWSDSAAGDHSVHGPYARFFQELLNRHILFPPSSFEAAFISLAHTPEDIDKTVQAIRQALEIVGRQWPK